MDELRQMIVMYIYVTGGRSFCQPCHPVSPKIIMPKQGTFCQIATISLLNI